MRRTVSVVVLIAIGAVAALGLTAVPAAVAAKPGIVHLEFSGTFNAPDFCGTGKTVVIDSSFHGTLFADPNQHGVDEWLTLRGRDIFTNPLNGETVVVHFDGAERMVFPGDPRSCHRHQHRVARAARPPRARRAAHSRRRLRRPRLHVHHPQRRDRPPERASSLSRVAPCGGGHVLRDDDRRTGTDISSWAGRAKGGASAGAVALPHRAS
jgi:hypothetical protein